MSTIGRTPPSGSGGQCSSVRGFTLVEVLVAATLGALLLLAAAASAGLMGQQVQDLNTDTHDAAAEALADISDEARFAWCAQVPDPRHLVLIDSNGGQTTYATENGALTVTRPDGSKGVVSSAITAAIFTAQNVSRFREAAPAQRPATLWAKAAPLLALPQGYVVAAGEQVALGFMTASPSPVAGSVAGVQEQTLSASLGLLNLKLAAVTPKTGSLTIRLHRARGPGDSRPEGSSLGQVTVAVSGVPSAVTTTTLTGAGLKNTYTTTTKKKKKTVETTLLALPPTASVPIDLSSLNAAIQPGYAYTLVIDNTATNPVVLEGYVLSSGLLSGVSLGGGSVAWAAQPVSLPLSLDGTVSVTRTTATPVAKSVLVELATSAGTAASGTIAVLGANLVDDPWLGAIPGETGP